MVTINEWDWKFKIGIYENVNSEVKNKIDFYMTPSEKIYTIICFLIMLTKYLYFIY